MEMWRRLSLLVLCCAVGGLDALEPTSSTDPSREKMLLTVAGELGKPDNDAPPTAKVELLGDYDKVKTVSSGSDCVCRCIVRPIKRSDCSRISDQASPSQYSYSVETITKGTDCKKCVCMAPPSAVNPCEGEYRFKKLQEASKDDIKLATIIDLLEGSLYGMDLLKLHSVTTKLLTRVDNMEKGFARNFTERAREKERVKERPKEKDKEKKAQQKKRKVNDLERSGQKSGAAASGNKQKNQESQLKNNQQEDGVEQQQPTRNKTGTEKPMKEKTEPKQPIKDKNSMVIRGPPPPIRTFPSKSPGPSTTVSIQLDSTHSSRSVSRPAPTQQPTAPQTTTKQTTTTTTPVPTTKPATESTTSIPPTTPKTTTTIKPTTASTTKITTTTTKPTTAEPVRTTIRPTITQRNNQQTISLSDTNMSPPINASPTAKSQPASRSRLTWTESPADQPKTTKKPCKDTCCTVVYPVNSYGLSDGAWMKDAHGHGNVIYLTNGDYGNNLLEFRDMETFKSGKYEATQSIFCSYASNSYKLPYSFTGTGHVVLNGAFYYNRAFSRDIIRYDLRHRYVAAWTTLHDALLEEHAVRTNTDSGLWLLYPALDTEGFHQEVILLLHLRHRDLQPIQSFRTGLRRGRYGNSFLVCGVLYAVNSMEHRYANVTYAFDNTRSHNRAEPGIHQHAHTHLSGGLLPPGQETVRMGQRSPDDL
ncbi:hypothetical protein F7725_012053 [Dissostichus mawsoni]|uniref:Olfactomedin-like domain-containing protein n=1 Tax=Dissostichus mawsoni TaxID=36200 RepID=A0A7J5ZAL2_DISMA|nr:hypothetical protein F7725_012053 [Dissostichus mawsoni]